MTIDPATGICGGQKGLAAYLAYMGVQSLDELEEEQLCLFPLRPDDEEHERPAAAAA